MRVEEMLKRCTALERRAAAMYRRFAEDSAEDDALRSLWVRLADEEEEHAGALGRAGARPGAAAQSRIDGWTDAVAEAERVLAEAEATPPRTPDERLALALDLERTEIDALREALLALAGTPEAEARATSRHAATLADVASRSSSDPRVLLKASLVHAHERLGKAAAGR